MIEIRVPATSANLGPGFDCLGMALAIYNRFLFEPADDFEMYNVDPRFDNDENLFLRAFMTESAILGKTTGILEMKVEDLRVEHTSVQTAAKGTFCSLAIPLAGMPADRVNDPTQLTPGEQLHPRRGDKVYLWVPED